MFITSADYVALDQEQSLKTHFHSYFALFCDGKSAESNGLYRHVSGIPSPSLNAVVGAVQVNADTRIAQELSHFAHLPFIWYVDEGKDTSFQAKLLEHGFQDIGLFRGVIGPLHQQVPEPVLPDGWTVERVTTEAAMEAFSALVNAAFEVEGVSQHLFKKRLWDLAHAKEPQVFLWLARNHGVPVSALSTFIEGPLVSFWTGATDPAARRRGFCTALLKIACRDAMARGCTFGASYLAAPGLAFGICTQLGYAPKWEFRAYLSP